MQTPIPPDTNREFDWIAGLSGGGLVVALVGTTVALGIWGEKPWPLAVRAPLAVITLLLTAAFAWLKWPMDDSGFPLTVWAQRIWIHYSQYRTPWKAITGLPRSRFGVEGGTSHRVGFTSQNRPPKGRQKDRHN
ncbi:hypothetical protein [Sulfobacillus thermosulfidooxidans]|uniref:hypothetical protein n=1 Tax=Sulfobacillus thermosulfidooxidans TaxID=28034 RepID=UPI0006B67E56|nr:hypothetical protein [Sulfobacillus thermosulfidooxidans]